MQIVFSKINEKNLGEKGAIAFVFALLTIFAATSAWAVSGPCNRCHTMHNSQNGTAQVSVGTGAAWSNQTGGAITGGSSTAPPGELLVSDCVGCHSMVGSAAITVNDGYNVIPIVYNTGGYPTNGTLAGGNFALVATDDTRGHNVRGISSDDSIHLKAPGMITGKGCNNSCHTDLTRTDAATTPTPGGIRNNGCRGCHIKTSHHDPNNNSYRFLSGHGGVVQDVGGIPDPNWEATPSSTEHNVYMYDLPGDGVELGPQVSMGRWCAGCHHYFHAWGQTDPQFGHLNGGDIDDTANNNPWLRHPTNVNFPSDLTGEYAALDLDPYNPTIPVAQQLLPVINPLSNQINVGPTGDQVFCLSCHRAHASDQPDALRFDYGAILSHQGSSPAIIDPDNDGFANGCFFCHNTKANL